MIIFGKSKSPAVQSIPEGFTAEDIRTESSICTGEKTIGFYSRTDKRLHYSELVRSSEDEDNFYKKYGAEKRP